MIGQKASAPHRFVAYDLFGAKAAFAENIINLAAPFAITVKRIDQPAGEVGIFLRHPLQNSFGLLVKVAAKQNFLFVCRAAEYQGKPFFSRNGIGIVEVRRKQGKRAGCTAKSAAVQVRGQNFCVGYLLPATCGVSLSQK